MSQTCHSVQINRRKHASKYQKKAGITEQETDKSINACACVGLILAGSMEADLQTVALFLPEDEPVINSLNSAPLKDQNVNKKNKNTGRRSLILTEGQEQTAGRALILDLCVCVCVFVPCWHRPGCLLQAGSNTG